MRLATHVLVISRRPRVRYDCDNISKCELHLARNAIVQSGMLNDKFLPVLLAGCRPEDIPDVLQGYDYYSLFGDGMRKEFGRLMARLTGKRSAAGGGHGSGAGMGDPAIVFAPPPIGQPGPRPPLKKVPSLFDL